MNHISLYLKAHLFNSSQAAVELADKKITKKNIGFAKKLLNIKMSMTNRVSAKNENHQIFLQQKKEHYNELTQHLNVICNQSEVFSQYNTLPEPLVRINFASTFLNDINLNAKDLRRFNFSILTPSFEERIDFSNSNLNGVDLTTIPTRVLPTANFSNASLLGTKMEISTADFTNAIMKNTKISFSLPKYWSESNFDTLLNDINCNHSLLHTINTIDDKYSGIKVNLLKQIITSLESSRARIDSPSFPKSLLLEHINAKSFYLTDSKIQAFVKKLTDGVDRSWWHEGLAKPSITNYNYKKLCRYTLTALDLRECNFTNANGNHDYVGSKILFNGSNLNGVDLTNTQRPIEAASFRNASLAGSKISINNADYTNAFLDTAEISFKLPEQWDEHKLNRLLNDVNNNSDTLFHTLNTIEDEYSEIKTALMKQIVTSLESSEININSSSFPNVSLLVNITSKDFYLKDDKIKAFAERIVFNELEKENNIQSLSEQPSVLSLFMRIISGSGHPDNNTNLITYNGSFIQLIALCTHHDDPQIQKQAKEIYNQYLNMSLVKPYTQLDIFGDGQGKPDWSDKNNHNYILINDNKAMIIDHENITKMLRIDTTDIETKWDHFYLYRNNECMATGDINYQELFDNDFKIFKNSYQFALKQASFNRLLSLLNLAEYSDRFKSVLSGEPVSSDSKLVSNNHQLRLHELFMHVLTYFNDNAKETALKQEHYEKLLQSYGIETADNEIKAKTLLALAAVFTKYSSSTVFGTEYESPQVLRDYAFALMSKAQELDPEVTKNNLGQYLYNDWKDKLLGLNDAFTCTAVLSSSMIEHGRTYFKDILSGIIPPIWG